MAFTYVTITETYETAGDVAATGTVEFLPIVSMHNDLTVIAAKVVATLSGSGALSVRLAANTDPDTTPTGSVYQVTERITGQKQLTYFVQIPHDQGSSLDLRTLAGWVGGVGGGGGGSGTVTAINGEAPDGTGNVVVSASDVGAQPAAAELTGLSGLNGDGYARRVGSTPAWVLRTPQELATEADRSPTPITLTDVSGTITPNAALGKGPHRHVAVGDRTLAQPTGGTDGQRVIVAVQASGADRVLSFAGGNVASLTIPSGKWFIGEMFYFAVTTEWVINTSSAFVVGGGGGSIADGSVALVKLATTGTASSSTYLRGDGAWTALAAIAASGSASDLASGTVPIARIPLGTSSATVTVGNDARLSDARTPTAHTHAATDITSGTVATARLGSGTASSTTFLRGDNTWATPAGGGGGTSATKSMEDAARAVWAKAPSSESALTAPAINGTTNDASRYQSILNYLSSTYGAGSTMYVPAGTSRMDSGITLPTGVRIVADDGAKWDFANAPANTVGISVTDDNRKRPVIEGLWLAADQTGANGATPNTTTKTAIKVHGARLKFRDLRIDAWNQGIAAIDNDTYVHAYESCVFTNNKIGYNCDIVNAFGFNPPSGSSNSGERMVFTNCLFDNSALFAAASGSGVSLDFSNCSFDYGRDFFRFRDCHVFFSNCHLETSGTTTPAGYLANMDFASRLTMTNCDFIMGSEGVYSAVNNGTASPGVYAMAHFDNCDAYFVNKTGVTIDYKAEFSNPVVAVTTGATTVKVASMFITKWSTIAVDVVAWNGNAAANVTARVTAIDYTNGNCTITLSGAAPANTYIRVNFG